MIKHTDPAPAAGSSDRLTYDGKPVCRRGNLLNLSTMWQATGRPPDCHPGAWLARPETKRFILHLRSTPPATPDVMLRDIAQLRYIRTIDPDFLLVTTRGRRRGTWAHWQIALAYAQSLSPPFHAWCNQIVRGSLERLGDPSASTPASVAPDLEHQLAHLHHRFDIFDRHAGDLMFLMTAAQELVLGHRRSFSGRSQVIMRDVVALQPFAGGCPCCGEASVLSPSGKLVAGAQFDHFFHRGLNRPEHGWIICGRCHDALNRGGYLRRFSKLPAFRGFQAAVITFIQAHHRSTQQALDNAPEA